jgi:hypothetical protein
LDPLPGDEDPTIYLRTLKEEWMSRLRGEISERLTERIEEEVGSDFGVQVRYVFNGLRVWFSPILTCNEGFDRPFAEEPCPKDKWFSISDIIAFTIPTTPDEQIQEMPRIIFGAGHWLQERYPDPEVHGGKIALIAFKQNIVQKPPNFLDRMNSRYQKQVAYNDRIIEAEKEVAAINCEAAEFLADMTLDTAEQVIICVNASEGMKRGEAAVAWQLWMQGDRETGA